MLAIISGKSTPYKGTVDIKLCLLNCRNTLSRSQTHKDTHTHTHSLTHSLTSGHPKWWSFLYLEEAQLIRVIVWEAPLTTDHEVHNWPWICSEEGEYMCVCVCVCVCLFVCLSAYFARKQDWDVSECNFSFSCHGVKLCINICTDDGS